MSKDLVTAVQVHFMPEYDPTNICLPNGLCTTCRVNLGKVKDNKENASSLPKPYPFSSLTFPIKTKSGPYLCGICEHARSTTPSKATLGRPRAEQVADSPPPSGPVTICQRCMGPFGKGAMGLVASLS